MGFPVASSFNMNAQLPLDSRFIMADVTARNAIPSGTRYEGLLVYVISTAKMYQLQGGILDANWTEVGAGSDPLKANLAGGNTFTGDQTFSNSVVRSVALNVSALTGGQAGAPSLTKDVNTVTSLNLTYGVKLPTLVVGKMIMVHNVGAQPVLVYPQSGDAIGNLAADAPVTLILDENALFFATETGKWKQFSGIGSSLTTKGDLYVYGTTNTRLGVGTNTHVLTADSTQSLGVKWAAPQVSLPTGGTANQALLKIDSVDNNATWTTLTKTLVGLSNVTNAAQVPLSTVAAKGDLIAGTASATVAALTVGSNGQVLTADSAQASGVKWATPSSSPLLAVASKTTTYTATLSDDLILCSASSAAWTLTLPAAASSAGKVFHIKKTDSTANILTVDGNASETIDGTTTVTLISQYESISIVCDGSNWMII